MARRWGQHMKAEIEYEDRYGEHRTLNVRTNKSAEATEAVARTLLPEDATFLGVKIQQGETHG